MKVLFHSVYYVPEVGGLESHMAGLAEGLVRRGHRVRVVTSRSTPELAAAECIRGVDVVRTWMPSRSTVGWALHALSSLGPMREGARWADVVHAESFASVVPAGRAARGAGRPLVASIHTSHFLRLAGSGFWRPLLGRIVRRPDHVLAASKEIASVAMALAPGVAVEPVTNGVDTAAFVPSVGGGGEPGRRPVVVVPRRLFSKNGVEHLIRAVPALVDDVPDVEVLIVGDGPERRRLEALAREVGAGEAIRFRGAVAHDRMPELLAGADVAVFPSLMEATSVAALEAMACGVPVVATSVGGLPEIVDADVGALVPPGDSPALARAIALLLRDPERAAKGARARARVVERWSNERLIDRHLEIYGALLERYEPAGRVGRGDPS